MKTELVQLINVSAESLAQASSAAREVVGEFAISETLALDDFFIAEGKLLKEFLYELVKYAYQPHGYEGHGHHDTHG